MKKTDEQKKPKPKAAAVVMTETKANSNGQKRVRPADMFSHKLSAADIPVIIDGLRKYHPILAIADKLDCSYDGLLRFIHKTPVLEETYNRQQNGMVDIAIGRLFENINMGNLNAIIYFLNTKGRDRGFGDFQSIEQTIKDKTPQRRIVIGNFTPEIVAAMKKRAEDATAQEKATAPVEQSPIATGV